jgi:SAM-dependent methyltransferase
MLVDSPKGGHPMSNIWVSGEAYERYVGRWSRLAAVEFLDWLAIGPRQRWLDVGCGTGALTSTILARCEPSTVLGIDPSEGFVALAKAQVDDARASFEIGDAAGLPAGAADVVVSGLMLNFVPDASAALRSMRAAAPAGVVAAYVWDYTGQMELMRYFWDAAVELDPDAVPLAEANRFTMCRPEPLSALWREAGLVDVTTRAIDVAAVFFDFDDYWTPFLAGQGPAPAYAVSLHPERRDALRDRLRAELPIAADGSINLTCRAWAVRGRST